MFDSNTYGASSRTSTVPQTDARPSGRHYKAIKEHLFSDLGDEAVILSLKNGKYYGLNSVGVTIWTNVQEATPLSVIEAAVMNEYDVDEETCRRAVSLFLEEMVREELIESLDAPSSQTIHA